jgi:hypothetical protein
MVVFSYMLHSVSENNLHLAHSWSNALAKCNKLWPVMPYNLFRWLVYKGLRRLTAGSHGVASVTTATVFLSDSAFKHTDKEGFLCWVICHIIYTCKVTEKIKVFVISCILHWMAVHTRLSIRISYNFVHPLLYYLTYQINKYEGGVTSNGKTFMPYYVQIGHLIQKLTEEIYTHRTQGDPVRPLFPLYALSAELKF